jgi:hypothetical protein
MHQKENEWNVKWIHLAQDKDNRNTAMKGFYKMGASSYVAVTLPAPQEWLYSVELAMEK